jgi:hypothetical protein
MLSEKGGGVMWLNTLKVNIPGISHINIHFEENVEHCWKFSAF